MTSWPLWRHLTWIWQLDLIDRSCDPVLHADWSIWVTWPISGFLIGRARSGPFTTRGACAAVKRDAKFLSRYLKGVPFVSTKHEGVLFLAQMVKGKGWTSGHSLPLKNFVDYPLPWGDKLYSHTAMNCLRPRSQECGHFWNPIFCYSLSCGRVPKPRQKGAVLVIKVTSCKNKKKW